MIRLILKKSNEVRKFTPKKIGIKKPKTFTERAHFFQNNFAKEIKMYIHKKGVCNNLDGSSNKSNNLFNFLSRKKVKLEEIFGLTESA